MAVFYLDVDDEITGAVTRLRSSSDYRVALALPAGSRVATSRMNFRLLAREAQAHQRRLAIVSPEPAVRAIAIAAGLPSYLSVQAYEEALAAERPSASEGGAVGPAETGAAAGAILLAEAGGAAGAILLAEAGGAAGGVGLAERGAGGAAAGGVAEVPSGAPEVPPGPSGATEVPPGPAGAPAVPPPVPQEAVPAEGVAGRPADVPAGVPAAEVAAAEAVRSASTDESLVDGGAGTADALAAVVPGSGEPPTRASTDAPTRAAALQGRSAGALPVVKPERRARREGGSRRLLLGLVALLVIVLVGAAAALVLLPSADIVLTPTAQVAGPVSIKVTADPAAASVDQASLTVPALQVPISLSASGSFPATGVKVDQKPAAGSVTFASNNPIDPVTIPVGTTVATRSGIEFQTTSTVVVPKATIQGTTITAGRAGAPIQAVNPGPLGNVPAGSIVVVPARLQAFLVSSTNPAPTSGGTRTETKIVSQSDYDVAVKALTAKLDASLAAGAADPALPPAGTTVFPTTARRDQPIANPLATALVGQPVETFDLALSANGTVTAVDEKQVTEIADTQLAATVPAGYQLFPEATRTTIADPTFQGTKVLLPVTALGEQWRPVTAEELLPLVKGKSVAEATAALTPYGTVQIQTWPGYVNQIPSLDGRIKITVAPPRRVGA